jgi:hypothetical protein
MRQVPSTLGSECSTSIYFPALSRFLTRPQLLTRIYPLPWEGHPSVHPYMIILHADLDKAYSALT